MNSESCPECEKVYDNLSYHWAFNESHRPTFGKRQEDIIRGILMGDGYISSTNKNPYLEVTMVSKGYLESLEENFGCLSNGVKKKQSAEESYKHTKKQNPEQNLNVENFRDLYRWTTKSHPELNKFLQWYDSGRKIWPKDIELTPTVLKHWYVCDGSWDTNGNSNSIQISTSDERMNKDKIESYFERVNLPRPSNWPESQRQDGSITCRMRWKNSNTRELFEYMGTAPRGFEYKFPKENHE